MWRLAVAIVAVQLCGIASAREVGGWTILELDESCVMTLEYEGKGETELGFFYAADGGYLLTVGNANWTPKPGNTYQVAIAIDGETWGPGPASALKETSKPTLALKFGTESEFEPAFRSGRSLRIYLGDELIDQLSLSGTDAAGSATRQCTARLASRLAAEAREKARFDHLPDNPFSSDSAVPSVNPLNAPNQMARLRSAGFSDADYPSAALRNGESGTVVSRLTVGTNGRASSCSVVASSGSATLDSSTCRFLQSRSRFNVATDQGGNPIESTITVPISWKMVSPPPPSADEPPTP